MCEVTRVTDLTPLEGMPLKHLQVNTNVVDLSALQNVPLTNLTIGWGVRDLSPLGTLPLTTLSLTMRPYGGIEALRSHKTLKTINSGKPEDFLKEYDTKYGPPK